MAQRFCLILQDCPHEQRQQAAATLSVAFSLKQNTCETVMESLPIVILDGLSSDECAALIAALAPLTMSGLELRYGLEDPTELPKIDWPKRPKIFKRPLDNIPQEYKFTVPLPDGTSATMLDLLRAQFVQMTKSANETGSFTAAPACA